MRTTLGIPYATAARFAAPRPDPVLHGIRRRLAFRRRPRRKQLDGPLGDIVPGMKVRGHRRGVVPDAQRVGAGVRGDAAPGAGVVPRRLVRHRRVIAACLRRHAARDRATGRRGVASTTGWVRSDSSTRDRSAASPTAACATRSARSNGCATTSRRSGAIPRASSRSGSRRAADCCCTRSRHLRRAGCSRARSSRAARPSATLDEARAALVLEALVKDAGVGDAAGLRDLSTDALVAAQSTAMVSLLGTVGMMPFHPMVDGDVVPATPADAFAAGRGGRGRARSRARPPTRCGSSWIRRRRHLRARRSSGGRRAIWVSTRVRPKTIGRGLRARPRAPTTRTRSGERCSATARCRCRAGPCSTRTHRTGPTYTYCFTWESPTVGACHGIDIPFPFGNFVDGWDAFVGLDDDGRRVVGGDARRRGPAFARTGDPGWPQYPRPASSAATCTTPRTTRCSLACP